MSSGDLFGDISIRTLSSHKLEEVDRKHGEDPEERFPTEIMSDEEESGVKNAYSVIDLKKCERGGSSGEHLNVLERFRAEESELEGREEEEEVLDAGEEVGVQVFSVRMYAFQLDKLKIKKKSGADRTLMVRTNFVRLS